MRSHAIITLPLAASSLASSLNHPPISSFSLETGQSLGSRQLDVDDTGTTMELLFQETDSGSPVLVYGTAYGDIVGWDLRMKGDAFKLENDIKQGLTQIHS